MRTTSVLQAFHIGRLIKLRWSQQGKLRYEISHARKVLENNKIKIYTVEELDQKPIENVRTNLLVPEDPPLDKNHPDWKAEPCYIYNDNDTLLEGLNQARVLTNTLEIPQLPSYLIKAENNLNLPDELHEEAQKKIKLSCIFDAYQELLPKRFLPHKPAFNLPRDYGITDIRKNKLLLNNLVQLCDLHSGSFDKSIMNDGFFILSLRISDKLVQLELSTDILLHTKKALLPIEIYADEETNPIPVLHPLNSTISLKEHHFYTQQDFFPIIGSKQPYVHTIFFSHNKTQVKNLYDGEVTENQILGRNLMKVFCAAAAQARAIYGPNASELISPVCVQSVMTDGKYFHFSVFQLNDLDVANEKTRKNIYWNAPPIPLYDKCEYYRAVPILKGYNPEVLRKIMTFYSVQ